MYQRYCAAHSVQEALEFLKGGDARILAGGTDLVIDYQEGKHREQTVVDITGIDALRAVSLEDDALFVGACCTFSQLERDPLVNRYARALAQASSQVGSPQIRNMATIGGNVANAMPAADGAVALMGLGAEVELAGQDGTARLPLAACYRGVGKSAVDSGSQIIVGFRVPLCVGRRACEYRRFALRTSLALPVAAVCVLLRVQEDLRIDEAHLAVAPAGIRPWRAEEAENFLLQKELEPETIAEASRMAAQAASFRDSPVRCSAAYKHMLAESLLRDSLQELRARLSSPEETK